MVVNACVCECECACNLWLIGTSCTFIIPVSFALYYNMYYHAICVCCLIFCSINYWRKPSYGLRRNIDILCVYTTGAIFTYSAYMAINNIYILSYCHLLLVIAFSTYKYGCYLNNLDHNNVKWVMYHGTFHIICVYIIMCVLYYIRPYYICV